MRRRRRRRHRTSWLTGDGNGNDPRSSTSVRLHGLCPLCLRPGQLTLTAGRRHNVTSESSGCPPTSSKEPLLLLCQEGGKELVVGVVEPLAGLVEELGSFLRQASYLQLLTSGTPLLETFLPQSLPFHLDVFTRPRKSGRGSRDGDCPALYGQLRWRRRHWRVQGVVVVGPEGGEAA